jgi:hypothetical protein
MAPDYRFLQSGNIQDRVGTGAHANRATSQHTGPVDLAKDAQDRPRQQQREKDAPTGPSQAPTECITISDSDSESGFARHQPRRTTNLPSRSPRQDFSKDRSKISLSSSQHRAVLPTNWTVPQQSQSSVSRPSGTATGDRSSFSSQTKSTLDWQNPPLRLEPLQPREAASLPANPARYNSRLTPVVRNVSDAPQLAAPSRSLSSVPTQRSFQFSRKRSQNSFRASEQERSSTFRNTISSTTNSFATGFKPWEANNQSNLNTRKAPNLVQRIERDTMQRKLKEQKNTIETIEVSSGDESSDGERRLRNSATPRSAKLVQTPRLVSPEPPRPTVLDHPPANKERSAEKIVAADTQPETTASQSSTPPAQSSPPYQDESLSDDEQSSTSDDNMEDLDLHGTESIASQEYQLHARENSSNTSVDTAGPPTEAENPLEHIQRVLAGIRKEMRSWQERKVQAELRKATLDASKSQATIVSTVPPDPFAVLTRQRRAFIESRAGNSRLVPQSRGPHKRAAVTPIEARSFSTPATSLPKYKAIGRVASSTLAPNHSTAKYSAYDAEDEHNDPEKSKKYTDFENNYNIDLKSLQRQRKCQELIWLWLPWINDMVVPLGLLKSDVLYFFVFAKFEQGRAMQNGHGSEQFSQCRTCGLAEEEHRYNSMDKDAFTLLSRPDDRKLETAALLARAFHENTAISLWHLVSDPVIRSPAESRTEKRATELCLICFRHECPDHGSFREEYSPSPGVYLNDSEKSRNTRKFMSLPDTRPSADSKAHVCGTFCVNPSTNLRQIIGKQSDSTVSGDRRASSGDQRQILADSELCGPPCFWNVTNRQDVLVSDLKFEVFPSPLQKTLVEQLMPFYLNNVRAPCLISRTIKDVSCLKVFNHIIFTIAQNLHPSAGDDDLDGSTAQEVSRKRKKFPAPPPEVSNEFGSKPPFLPCSHEGPCLGDTDCTCSRDRVHCERFCGCDSDCKRRFAGCSCKATGKRTCFEDSRCDCWVQGRECDPVLCGSCGVREVLDSANKYNDEVRVGRCTNNRIQLGLPAPTTKAPSQVQGYGLYSRAHIPQHEFIGEYTGEIVSRKEADRRGTIYHLINQEYLFDLNSDQEIDASTAGNKMRFMNNSQLDKNINVQARSMLCSGVVRIGLFARRPIEAGEELLWQYGYAAELVKCFWEPGEKPATERALIPLTKERLARKTAKKTITKTRLPSAQSPTVKQRKRKRRVVESPANSDVVDDGPRRIEDSGEDSDYDNEVNNHVSGEDDDDSKASELVQTSDSDVERPRRFAVKATGGRRLFDSASENRSMNSPDRMSRIAAGDRRYGGEAQRQAWLTRKSSRQ